MRSTRSHGNDWLVNCDSYSWNVECTTTAAHVWLQLNVQFFFTFEFNLEALYAVFTRVFFFKHAYLAALVLNTIVLCVDDLVSGWYKSIDVFFCWFYCLDDLNSFAPVRIMFFLYFIVWDEGVLLGACLIVLNQLQQMKLWNKDDQLTMVWINTAASVRESPCFRWLTVFSMVNGLHEKY